MIFRKNFEISFQKFYKENPDGTEILDNPEARKEKDTPTVKDLADDARDLAQKTAKKGEELWEQARRLNGWTENADKWKTSLDAKKGEFENAYQEYLKLKGSSDQSPEAKQKLEEATKKLAENEKAYQEEMWKQLSEAKGTLPAEVQEKAETQGLGKALTDLHYNNRELTQDQIDFVSKTFPKAWEKVITDSEFAKQNPEFAKLRDKAIERALQENGNISREPQKDYQKRLVENLKKNLGVNVPDDYLTSMWLERYNGDIIDWKKIAGDINYDSKGNPTGWKPESGRSWPVPSQNSASEPTGSPNAWYEWEKWAPTNELLGMLGGNEQAIRKGLEKPDFCWKTVELHGCIVPKLKEIEKQVEATGYKINGLEGFNWRTKRNGSSLSNHALGIAFDINPSKNMGSFWDGGRDIPQKVVDIFKNAWFIWGGDWKSPYDPMHFEYSNKQKLQAAFDSWKVWKVS